jgi:hypothetical protein
MATPTSDMRYCCNMGKRWKKKRKGKAVGWDLIGIEDLDCARSAMTIDELSRKEQFESHVECGRWRDANTDRFRECLKTEATRVVMLPDAEADASG